MNLWARWLQILARTESGTALALFRIALATCALWNVGSAVSHDLVDAIWIDQAYGGYRDLGKGGAYFKLVGGATPTTVWTAVVLSLSSSLLLIVGLGGRWTAFLALQSFQALSWANGHAGGSYDLLLANGMWLLVLGRSTATLSADCRLRQGRWTSDQPISAWPRYLVVLQLVVMYTSTGLHKVSASWTPAGDFSALYFIFQQPTWQRFDMAWTAHVFPLTQLATVTTWLWEISAPLLLLSFWYRWTRLRGGRLRGFMNRLDWRRPFALFGLVLHLGIYVVMEVGTFTPTTLCFYLCLWHPDEWHLRFRRLRPPFPGARVPDAERA
ncbi:MAG: hypothetical protein QGG40_02600 [Myxococcota bacterium]|nr:hypothetical protein [Myxococcota bacterium]